MRNSLVATTILLCACVRQQRLCRPPICGTPGANQTAAPDRLEHQHVRETKLLVGVDKAWAAYPAVFGELGIPPGIVDEKQHVFGNAGTKIRNSLGRQRLSKYLECGTTAGMSNADTYDVIVRVVSQVVPADAGLASLRTQVEATAHANAVSGASVRCVSTGALEDRIAHMLSELTTKPAS